MKSSFFGLTTNALNVRNNTNNNILSVKAKERRYMMTGVANYRREQIESTMFARLGTDHEIRNQCSFAIFEAMTTDRDLS